MTTTGTIVWADRGSEAAKLTPRNKDVKSPFYVDTTYIRALAEPDKFRKTVTAKPEKYFAAPKVEKQPNITPPPFASVALH